jgi:hypothetical protein
MDLLAQRLVDCHGVPRRRLRGHSRQCTIARSRGSDRGVNETVAMRTQVVLYAALVPCCFLANEKREHATDRKSTTPRDGHCCWPQTVSSPDGRVGSIEDGVRVEWAHQRPQRLNVGSSQFNLRSLPDFSTSCTKLSTHAGQCQMALWVSTGFRSAVRL